MNKFFVVSIITIKAHTKYTFKSKVIAKIKKRDYGNTKKNMDKDRLLLI